MDVSAFPVMAKAQREYMVKIRRELHMHPELGWQERETQKRICAELEKLGVRYETPHETCVLARLGPQEGPAVGLRADMDALPVTEEGTSPYASQEPGVMHACGHDAHVAILLGVARMLAAQQQALPVGIQLIFQPAEESMLGGRAIAALPQLQGLAAVGALHVWAALPVGTINVEAGPRMARADLFEMVIKGVPAHGSMPNEGVDALYVASMVVNAIQAVVSRECDPRDAAVVTVGLLQSGTISNVLAGEARLSGTIRSFGGGPGEMIPKRLEEIGGHIAAAFRATCDFHFIKGVPELVNDERQAAIARECAALAVGEGNLVSMRQTTGGEDFAFFLQRAPGVMAFVGSGNVQKGIDKPQHHAAFDIDEDALVHGAAYLAAYAVKAGENALFNAL